MQHASAHEMAPGLSLRATPEEIDAWMKVEQEGIKTTIFEAQKFVLIAYDRDSQHNNHMSVMGDVTIIGMPLPWIHLKIAWYQKMGYKQIFVQPMSIITPKAAVKRVEVHPGLLSDYSNEEFDAWMKVDPPGIMTKIAEDGSVTIYYDRPGDNSKVFEGIYGNPWPWVYLRMAWYQKIERKVTVRPIHELASELA